MKKKLLYLIGVMIAISLVAAIVINTVTGPKDYEKKEEEDAIDLVASFYPMYIIGLNLLDGVDEFHIRSLTSGYIGCLHDYQLTTEDMKNISSADIFLMNGGGMESFMDTVMKNYPDLYTMNTSEGIELLSNDIKEHLHEHEDDHNHSEDGHEHEDDHDHTEDGHDHEEDHNHTEDGHDHEENHNHTEDGHDHEEDHDHAEDGHDHEEGHNHTEDGHNHDQDYAADDQIDGSQDQVEEKHIDVEDTANTDDSHDGHTHSEYNAHVWLDPAKYMVQIENAKLEIIHYIEDHTNWDMVEKQATIEKVKQNADTYISKIKAVDEKLISLMNDNKDAIQEENQEGVVVFHDAFVYIASRIGLNVARSIEIEQDTQLSPREIAEIVDEINNDKISYLFTEKQYGDKIATQIQAETGVQIVQIDSAVTGESDKDAYIKAMEFNLDVLQEMLQ